MSYAIIRTGGKQYRVEPGDVIRVESLAGEVGSEVRFAEVLLRATGDEVDIGNPLIGSASVTGTIVAHEKARKILVFKKKRRKKYRRHHGHRQHLTAVKVVSVG